MILWSYSVVLIHCQVIGDFWVFNGMMIFNPFLSGVEARVFQCVPASGSLDEILECEPFKSCF